MACVVFHLRWEDKFLPKGLRILYLQEWSVEASGDDRTVIHLLRGWVFRGKRIPRSTWANATRAKWIDQSSELFKSWRPQLLLLGLIPRWLLNMTIVPFSIDHHLDAGFSWEGQLDGGTDVDNQQSLIVRVCKRCYFDQESISPPDILKRWQSSQNFSTEELPYFEYFLSSSCSTVWTPNFLHGYILSSSHSTVWT